MKLPSFKEEHAGRTTHFLLVDLYSGNESLSAKEAERDFVAMAGQWKQKQMVPHVEWKGTLNTTAINDYILMESHQATSSRLCTWITPLSKSSGIPDNETNWPKGVISGENNGLVIILDAESYDYVEHEGGGLGFKISVVHPFEMPIIEQSGISVEPGTSTNLGVSTTFITTTADAIKRFTPHQRKCWVNSEIDFQFLPYESWYHYSMTNCLFEAAMQEANRTCRCIPGYIKPSPNQCTGKNLKCFKDIIENLGKQISLANCQT